MLNAVGLIIYALLKLSQTTTRINLNSYIRLYVYRHIDAINAID